MLQPARRLVVFDRSGDKSIFGGRASHIVEDADGWWILIMRGGQLGINAGVDKALNESRVNSAKSKEQATECVCARISCWGEHESG